MTKFLIRCFIKDAENVGDPEVRSAYGKMAGVCGIAANVLLFLGKLLAGVLSGAVSVIADAFNNLSDAASAVVTLLGFKLAEAPPDDEHPFGHGRMEYLSGLVLGALILVAGVELGKSSIGKILHPEATNASLVALCILGAAILVKLWMAVFYKTIGKRIQSDTVLATGKDSRNDVLSTLLVLASVLVERFTGLQIDGYAGLIVTVLVLLTGVSVLKESVSPLLGQAPDPAMVEEIRRMVLSYDGVVGIHDLIVHNYGPGRVVISLHAEVPADEDILKSHDVIDCIEADMMKRFHAVTCIHMDPVEVGNEAVDRLKVLTETVLGDIDERLTLHDFRMVPGESHTNVLFDVVVPHGYAGEATLKDDIERRLRMTDNRLNVVCKIEHQYHG